MGNFQICLDATAPLLLYLAAGYLARRLKQIDSQDVSRFNSVVFSRSINLKAITFPI